MLPPEAYMGMYTFRYKKHIHLSTSKEHPDTLLSNQTEDISALFIASRNVLNIFGGWAGEKVLVHYNCRRVDKEEKDMKCPECGTQMEPWKNQDNEPKQACPNCGRLEEDK